MSVARNVVIPEHDTGEVPSADARVLSFGGDFAAIPFEARRLLLHFGALDATGGEVVPVSAAEAVKQLLKDLLRVPRRSALKLFTDGEGSALLFSPAGDVILDGYLAVLRPGGTEECLSLQCNLTRGIVFLDGRRALPPETGALFAAVEAEHERPASLDQLLNRAACRAHFPVLKGYTEDGALLVTRGPLSPHPFVVHYGPLSSMLPVSVDVGATVTLGLGVVLQGTEQRGKQISILLPAPSAAPGTTASYDGKRVSVERFVLNGYLSACG